MQTMESAPVDVPDVPNFTPVPEVDGVASSCDIESLCPKLFSARVEAARLCNKVAGHFDLKPKTEKLLRKSQLIKLAINSKNSPPYNECQSDIISCIKTSLQSLLGAVEQIDGIDEFAPGGYELLAEQQDWLTNCLDQLIYDIESLLSLTTFQPVMEKAQVGLENLNVFNA